MQDLPVAQYALGKLYLSDDSEVHDVEEGIRWLKAATQNGSDYAAYRLGKEYLRGKFVEQDEEQAVATSPRRQRWEISLGSTCWASCTSWGGAFPTTWTRPSTG